MKESGKIINHMVMESNNLILVQITKEILNKEPKTGMGCINGQMRTYMTEIGKIISSMVRELLPGKTENTT